MKEGEGDERVSKKRNMEQIQRENK